MPLELNLLWGEVLGHKAEYVSQLIQLRGKETGVVILKLDYQPLLSPDFFLCKAFFFLTFHDTFLIGLIISL